jgi:hypothetical protein
MVRVLELHVEKKGGNAGEERQNASIGGGYKMREKPGATKKSEIHSNARCLIQKSSNLAPPPKIYPHRGSSIDFSQFFSAHYLRPSVKNSAQRGQCSQCL